MPIVLRHNEKLELNRVDYSGAISVSELKGLADFQAAAPTWLTYDCLNLVQTDASFSSVDFTELDALFAYYGELFAPITFVIMRRSAWLYQSPMALAHVRHWLHGRDLRTELSSDVRLLNNFTEAGDWLVLKQGAVAALESGEGFAEVFTIQAPAAAMAR